MAQISQENTLLLLFHVEIDIYLISLCSFICCVNHIDLPLNEICCTDKLILLIH